MQVAKCVNIEMNDVIILMSEGKIVSLMRGWQKRFDCLFSLQIPFLEVVFAIS